MQKGWLTVLCLKKSSIKLMHCYCNSRNIHQSYFWYKKAKNLYKNSKVKGILTKNKFRYPTPEGGARCCPITFQEVKSPHTHTHKPSPPFYTCFWPNWPNILFSEKLQNSKTGKNKKKREGGGDSIKNQSWRQMWRCGYVTNMASM